MQFWIKCTRHQDGAPCFVNISMVGLMHREGDRTILEFVGDGILSTDVRETPEQILELHTGVQSRA
jgi:hypothetical protein